MVKMFKPNISGMALLLVRLYNSSNQDNTSMDIKCEVRHELWHNLNFSIEKQGGKMQPTKVNNLYCINILTHYLKKKQLHSETLSRTPPLASWTMGNKTHKQRGVFGETLTSTGKPTKKIYIMSIRVMIQMGHPKPDWNIWRNKYTTRVVFDWRVICSDGLAVVSRLVVGASVKEIISHSGFSVPLL